MTDLQNKVKSLEQENQNLKQSLKMFRDERSRAVS
jgi:cell shape-determining protein MreC